MLPAVLLCNFIETHPNPTWDASQVEDIQDALRSVRVEHAITFHTRPKRCTYKPVELDWTNIRGFGEAMCMHAWKLQVYKSCLPMKYCTPSCTGALLIAVSAANVLQHACSHVCKLVRKEKDTPSHVCCTYHVCGCADAVQGHLVEVALEWLHEYHLQKLPHNMPDV